MEELRLVSKAKVLLVEKKKMTEDEAHRLIGKQAMDQGISRRRAAQRLLDDLE
jgi:response regulator NasT